MGVIYRSLGVICMSWTTVLQARPSGERLDGFQAVGAVLRGGGSPGEAIWGSFGTSLGSFGASCFLMFLLKWLFDGIGLHLGSQNTSKMRPKGGPKPKPEFH